MLSWSRQLVANASRPPERWATALERALANGIEVFTSAVDGQRFATSATQLDTLYPVDAYSYACPAAMAGDPVCQHRAALRFILGWLTVPGPDDVETPASIPCPACAGHGWTYAEVDGGRSWPDHTPCRRCDGTGRLAVVLRALPAVVPALAAD